MIKVKMQKKDAKLMIYIICKIIFNTRLMIFFSEKFKHIRQKKS